MESEKDSCTFEMMMNLNKKLVHKKVVLGRSKNLETLVLYSRKSKKLLNINLSKKEHSLAATR